MEGGACKMPFCQNNQIKALLCSISHCPWMGITIEVEESRSIIIVDPLPLHINVNEQQTESTKEFPTYSWWLTKLQICHCMTNNKDYIFH